MREDGMARRPRRVAAHALLLAAAMLAAAAPAAEAQFGRLGERVKRGVTERVVDRAAERAGGERTDGAAADSAAAAPAAGPRRPAADAPAPRRAEEPAVLPITDEVLGRFVAGLRAEQGEVAAHERREAEHRRQLEVHGQCTMDVMQSAEYQRFGEQAQAAADRNDQNGAMKHMQEQMDFVKRKCPDVGSVGDPREAKRTKALEASRLTARQYAVLEERIVPICASGARRDARMVWSDEELAALRPRCGEIVALLDRVR